MSKCRIWTSRTNCVSCWVAVSSYDSVTIPAGKGKKLISTTSDSLCRYYNCGSVQSPVCGFLNSSMCTEILAWAAAWSDLLTLRTCSCRLILVVYLYG